VSDFRTVARVADLAPGDILPVSVGDTEIIVYRSGDDVFAAQRRCIHQGADLVDGLVSRGFLICAVHGWRYHCDTGVHEMAPENCLVTYRVRVEGDEIQVDPTPIRNARIPE
jgi:3-phenylpropionate/trans-cinnamate dioxygenase ferredoxin subunit